MDENEKQLNTDDLKVLRTYTSDMAEAVRKNEISVIKIALAEKEKKEREMLLNKEIPNTGSSKKFIIAGGAILLVFVILGSYLLIKNKKNTEPVKTATTTKTETFILDDSQSFIDVTNITKASDAAEIIKKETRPNPNLIKTIFLTRKIKEVEEMLTSKSFLTLIETTAPNTLIRTFSDKYLLGKYSTVDNKPTMFLIFQTTNYPQAYASMLDWEKTMLQDLSLLFEIPTQENSPTENNWKDIIISNRDARVLYGNNGEEILYYAFVNKDNLIITDNAETLKEVISRLIMKNSKSL